MPLSQLTYTLNTQWTLFHSNGAGYQNATQSDSQFFNLLGVNVGTFNELYAATTTVVSMTHLDVDLTSLTNLVSESFSFGHVLSLIVMPTGSDVTVEPGPSNGLQWFFGASSSIVVLDGNMCTYTAGKSGPGAVVDATHKIIRFANGTGVDLSLDLVIIGSTT